MTAMHYEGYVATIELDEVAGMFHGEVINTCDVLTFHGKSFDELRTAFANTIADYLVWCRERSKMPERLCSEPQEGQERGRPTKIALGQRALELGVSEMKIRRFITDLDAACRSMTIQLQASDQCDREKAIRVLKTVYDFVNVVSSEHLPIDDDLVCTMETESASLIKRMASGLGELKYGIVDPIFVRAPSGNRPRSSAIQKSNHVFYKSLYDSMAEIEPQANLRFRKLSKVFGIEESKLKNLIRNCRK